MATKHELKRRLHRRWREVRPAKFADRAATVWRLGGREVAVWMVLAPIIFALIAITQAWLMVMVLAAAGTLYAAIAWQDKGEEEIIAFYGGDDEEVRRAGLRKARRLFWVNLGYSTLFFGGWGLAGRMDLWCVPVAAGLYAFAVPIGARMFSWVFKPLLGTLFVGVLILPLLLAASALHLPGGSTEGLTWLVGALTPAGWAMLIVRDLAGGQWLMLALLPVLVVAHFLSVKMARVEEEKLLSFIPDPPTEREPRDGREMPPLDGGLVEEDTVISQLAIKLRKGVATITYKNISPEAPTSQWRWLVLLLPGLAVLNVKYDLMASEKAPLLVVAAIGAVFFTLVPVMWMPTWMQMHPISRTRVVPLLAFFPLTFRQVVVDVVRRQLWKIGRVVPFFFGSVLAAFVILQPQEWRNAVLAGVVVTLFCVTKTAIHWWYLTCRVTAPVRALSLSALTRSGLILIVVLLVLVESAVVLGCGFALLNGGRVRAVMAAWVLGATALTTVLGLAGAWLNLLAYEKGSSDPVRVDREAERRG